jgi:PAS domain S-box-containing protein
MKFSSSISSLKRHSRMLLAGIQNQSLDARVRGHDGCISDIHLCKAVLRTQHPGLNTIITLITVMLLSMPSPICAAAGKIRFEHLTMGGGLSGATVYSIHQDNRGFMWFGVDGGLIRYDGSAFKTFGPGPANPNNLSDGGVHRLFEDRLGTLWIATRNGGLNRFDPHLETFTRYQHDANNQNSLSCDSFSYSMMYEDAVGMLWVGTRGGGLNRLDPSTKIFTHYRHDKDDPGSLSSDFVTDVCADPGDAGILWIGTDAGLDRLDTVSGRSTHFHHSADDFHTISTNDVRIIRSFPETGKVLWIGTGEGLNRFDPASGAAIRYRHDPNRPDSLSQNEISDICSAGDGTLWISTHSGGLNRFDPQTGSFLHYRHNADDPDSLSSDMAHPLFRDRTGALWIGIWPGVVDRLDPEYQHFRVYRNYPGVPYSLSDTSILGMTQDHNGEIWIGTSSGGLNRFDPVGEAFVHYRHDPNDRFSLSHNKVFRVYEDQRRDLWVGTWGGLNRFDRETRTFIRYLHDDDDPGSLSGNQVTAIAEDREGTLWIGTTDGGVNRFHPETGTFVHYQHDPEDSGSLKSNRVWSLFRDSNDTLWVGTGSGLDRFDPGNGKFTHYQNNPNDPSSLSNNVVLNFIEDRRGTLWMATQMGLNRLDRTAGKFIQYLERDGLPHNTIESLVEDDLGNLWLGTGKGLSKFDPQTGAFRNYDVSDGLQGNQFNYPAFLKDKGGSLYFGGPSGLNVFHPGELKDNPHIPPVILTDFQLLNKSVPVGGDSVLKQSIGYTKEVVLAHDQNSFGFEFAALNYSAPQRNGYAFTLEGFDKGWTGAGSVKRTAVYTNLNAGEYTFRVKASNNDGLWNEEGTSVKVIILPAWWQTWWFRGTAFLMFAGLLLLGVWLCLATMKSRTRELEQQFEERTAAVRRHESSMTSLIEKLPGMVYRCQNDANRTMEFVSDGCVQLTGYDPEDIIENKRLAFAELIHPEDMEYIRETIQEALQETRPYELVYRINTATGEEKWVLEKGSGIFAATIRLVALEGFIADVTDLRTVGEGLRTGKRSSSS